MRRRILAHGMRRLAHRDTSRAEKTWRRLVDDGRLPGPEAGRAAMEIALAHAREGQLTVATKKAVGIKAAAVRARTLIRVSEYVPSREKGRWVVRCEAR